MTEPHAMPHEQPVERLVDQPVELVATCWTHAGDAVPVPGHHLSPLDLRVRAEAVAAAGFTIDDLEAAGTAYSLSEVTRICDDLGLVHREVELLEGWRTTGRRRRESARTRVALEPLLAEAHSTTLAVFEILRGNRAADRLLVVRFLDRSDPAT